MEAARAGVKPRAALQEGGRPLWPWAAGTHSGCEPVRQTSEGFGVAPTLAVSLHISVWCPFP